MNYSFPRTLTNLVRVCFCSILTGTLTALVILLYKICAHEAILASETGYTYLRSHLYWVPAVLLVLAGVAVLVSCVYRKRPDIQGGGIPTSIGILRGFIRFDWLRNLIGTFFLSVFTFLLGVPLGNEGPSVQMGTAVGRGVTRLLPKSQRHLDRYAMTCGACTGFASAVGAPISGMIFAVEELCGRVSPLALLMCAASVLSARVVLELLAPLCGVSVSLFPHIETVVLSVRDLWLPLLVGVVIGLFSVLFLKYYHILQKAVHFAMQKCKHGVLIFILYALTVGAGICSFSFVSTGHDLILNLMENAYVMPLLLILAVRGTLGLSANSTGITGGIFVPILAMGALVSALLCKGLQATVGLSPEYNVIILLLGICGCIAATMKMPLTAVVFAVEVLSCYTNLLAVMTVAVTAFVVTELFGVRSINERVLERKLRAVYAHKTPTVYKEYVTVKQNSFVDGKRVGDVLWPANVVVLSVRKNAKSASKSGQVEELDLHAGSVLHVRYATLDKAETQEHLYAMVGKQEAQ